MNDHFLTSRHFPGRFVPRGGVVLLAAYVAGAAMPAVWANVMKAYYAHAAVHD